MIKILAINGLKSYLNLHWERRARHTWLRLCQISLSMFQTVCTWWYPMKRNRPPTARVLYLKHEGLGQQTTIRSSQQLKARIRLQCRVSERLSLWCQRELSERKESSDKYWFLTPNMKMRISENTWEFGWMVRRSIKFCFNRKSAVHNELTSFQKYLTLWIRVID